MATSRGPAFRPGSGGGSGSGSSLPDPVTAAHGGTGLATLTSGSLLTGAGTGNVTFTSLPLSLANGGTGAASAHAAQVAISPLVTTVITEAADAFTPVDATLTDIFRCALTTGTNTINQVTAGQMYEGQEIFFRMEQDGTGGRTVVWDTTGTDSFKFTTTNPVPTLSTGVSAIDLIKFKYDATSQRLVCAGYNLGIA